MVYCYIGYMNHHRILICQYFDPQIPGKQTWQTPMRSSKMSIFFRFRNPKKKTCGLVGDLHLAMGPYNGTVSYFKGGNSTHCPKMLRQNLRRPSKQARMQLVKGANHRMPQRLVIPSVAKKICRHSHILYTYILTFYLALSLTFELTYMLTFYLAFYFTFQQYVLTMFSGILPDIYSDISFDILFDIRADICFDILSGILPDIHSDILSGILFHILADIRFDILSGILPDIYSDISSGILFDIPADIYSDISFDILFDIRADICFDNVFWHST